MAQNVWALIHTAKRAKGTLYGISFPDFPGVVSSGKTADEAVERGRATLTFHIQGMLEDGEVLPPIRSLDDFRKDRDVSEAIKSREAFLIQVPVELPGKPVRVNISIDDKLLSAIDQRAEKEGKTRSGWLAEIAKSTLKGAA